MAEAADDMTSGNGTGAWDDAGPDEAGGAPVVPEVVEQPEPASQLPALRDERYTALERAAEAALLPGVPGRDEFLTLAMTARILSLSAGAPKPVRDNPHLALHMAMIGRDLGISPSASLQLIDVIGFKDWANTWEQAYADVQLSVSPELLNSQIKRMGLGSIVKGASTDTSCVAIALAPGGHIDTRCARIWPDHVADDARGGPCTCTMADVLGEVEFTWADAIQAQLVYSGCTGPQAHTEVCMKGGKDTGKLRCHQGYRTYPKRMMWWRAAAWCQSDYFPEAGVGLYTPEELGAMVDEEGRAIDPASVQVPEGYEPKPPPPPPPSEDLLADAPDDDQLAADRRDLRARLDAIAVLPEAKAALSELWQQRNDDDTPKTPPFPYLRRRHLTRAKAITKQVEDRIKRGDWGDDAKAAWADAAVSAAGFGAGKPQEAQDAADDLDAQEEAEPAAGAPGGQEAPETAADEDRARREQEAVEQYERDVAAPTATELEVAAARAAAAAPPTREELGHRIAQEVAKMEPTAVLAKLGELLPEGEAVPRTKDARGVRLTDLLVEQAMAPTEEPHPAADELPLDGSADDQTLG